MNVSTASVCAVDRDQAVTSVLLHNLASDDEFRARLSSHPHDVFAELGLEPPAGLPVTLTLPAKEDVVPLLADALQRNVVSGAGPSLFCWFV